VKARASRLRNAAAERRTRWLRGLVGSNQPVLIENHGKGHADNFAPVEVQDAIADEFGWFATSHPRAWKVGAASHEATPSAAPLPARGIVESPATFAAGAFHRRFIEGEVAFRLRTAVPDCADVTSVAKAIGEWLVTIEIVDPRYADMEAAGPTLKLADQGLHGALVVGSDPLFPRDVDWTSLEARVRRNGSVVKETRGGHPLGNVLVLLPWLARHAAARGMPLEEGDLVTAGTWTGVVEALPGETIDVEFPAIGRASARFE
jgi:2-keto-4-pentenoate hydratase